MNQNMEEIKEIRLKNCALIICRVCLSTSVKKCMSLFETVDDHYLFEYINSFTNVEIREGDGLPDSICPECILDLRTVINFKHKCEKSDLLLRTSLEETSSCNGHSHLDDAEEKHNIIVKGEVTYKSDIRIDDTNELGDYVFPEVVIPTTKSVIKELETISITKSTPTKQSVIKELKTISVTKSTTVFKSRAIDLQLECNECGGKFTSKCKLRVHWKRVHLPVFLTCQYCKKKLGSVLALNQHKNGGSKFCSLAKLGKFNIEGEWKFRVFHCKDCDYKTRRTQDIRYHIYTHSGEKPFHCKLCSAKFTQYASLDSHMETVHKIFKNQITCQYCGKLVAGRMQVYRHLRHHMDNKVQCDVCKKVLKNSKSLKVHMLLHSGAKKFTCDLCAQLFFTLSGLRNHKRFKHDELFYQCSICQYKSSKKQSILKHERRHLCSNFPCLVCGRFFDSKPELVKHRRIHIEDGKLECPHCDKKFVSKKSLGKHVKQKHKIELACKDIGDEEQK